MLTALQFSVKQINFRKNELGLYMKIEILKHQNLDVHNQIG